MKSKMLYWLILFLGTLWTSTPVQGHYIDAKISDDILAELSNELTPVECWITASFLAQQSSNPKVKEEISKIGGNSKEYNCYEALTYWNEENEIQVDDAYGLRLLGRAMAFAGRKDREEWILTAFVYQQDYEESDESKSKSDIDFGDFFKSAFTQPPEEENDSETSTFVTIVVYIVGFTLGLLISTWVITTLIDCFRVIFVGQRQHVPRRFEEENGGFGYLRDSGHGYWVVVDLKSDRKDIQFGTVKLVMKPKAAGNVSTKPEIGTEESETRGPSNIDPEVDPNVTTTKSPEDI